MTARAEGLGVPTAVPAWLAVLLVLVLLAGCAPRPAGAGPAGPGPDVAAGTPAWRGDALRMADGAELPLRVWAPPGDTATEAVVVAVHGFNDYSHAFEMPGTWLAERGIQVYAYDQRGFGGAPHRGIWPGQGALARDLGAAVRLIRQRHPDTPVHVLGVSMGGAVVLAAASFDLLPPVDGAILVAPAVWGRATMPFYQRWTLWLAAHTVPWMTFTGEDLDRWPTDNHAMETRVDAMHGLTNLMDTALRAGDDVPRPALLLYGAKDEIVPPAPMRRFWESLGKAPALTRALYADGWHMLLRDKQAKVVWRDIAAWIADPEAPLPSGAGEKALKRLSAL